MSVTVVRFTVPGEPKGKGSVRASIVGKKSKNPHVKTFTDPQTRNAMAVIQDHAERAMADADLEPLEGPVVLGIWAFRSSGRPGTKIGDQAAEIGVVRPTKKPDVDNYSKAVADALNSVCYLDDGQIVRLVVEKHFSKRPRMEIVVQEWRADPRRLQQICDLRKSATKFIRRIAPWFEQAPLLSRKDP